MVDAKVFVERILLGDFFDGRLHQLLELLITTLLLLNDACLHGHMFSHDDGTLRVIGLSHGVKVCDCCLFGLQFHMLTASFLRQLNE